MKLVLIGTSTDEKRFLILCLAKIFQVMGKTVVYSSSPYNTAGDGYETFEYCGIEIRRLGSPDQFAMPREESYSLIDAEMPISLSEDFKAIAVCQPSRKLLEDCVSLCSQFSWANPSIDFLLVYLNLFECSRIGKRYLDLYWERHLPSFAKLTAADPFYFEETNHVAMLEAQYSERLSLKHLSPVYKKVLLNLAKTLLSCDGRQARNLLKKAERMK